MVKCVKLYRVTRQAALMCLTSLVIFIPHVEAADFKFAKAVDFEATGLASLASIKVTFLARPQGKNLNLILSGLSAQGADPTQELRTVVDAGTLRLKSSKLADLKNGGNYYTMTRKEQTGGLLSPDPVDVLEYKQRNDSGGATTTYPYAEFEVVDFLSVILVAARYVHGGDTKPVNLSMLVDRSVKRVVMRRHDNDNPNTVKVSLPDVPEGGFTYLFSKTPTGEYYPATISAVTSQGVMEIAGTAR